MNRDLYFPEDALKLTKNIVPRKFYIIILNNSNDIIDRKMFFYVDLRDFMIFCSIKILRIFSFLFVFCLVGRPKQFDISRFLELDVQNSFFESRLKNTPQFLRIKSHKRFCQVLIKIHYSRAFIRYRTHYYLYSKYICTLPELYFL